MKIPDEIIISIIIRALHRARIREYVKCMKDRGDEQLCTELTKRIRRFTIADFEVEARKWIADQEMWGYNIESLKRKLRRINIVKHLGSGVYELIT